MLHNTSVVSSLSPASVAGSVALLRVGTIRQQALPALAKGLEAIEAAQRIIDVVAFYGLTKVDSPEPLPPITEEDIGVVCWMAVLPEPK